jgi:predicted Zn-dependent protease
MCGSSSAILGFNGLPQATGCDGLEQDLEKRSEKLESTGPRWPTGPAAIIKTCLEPMAEPDQAADADTWADKIEDALNRGERHPLALAEEAVRACPGDYSLLCLAATTALIEERPDRAQLYLKRLRKRYEPGPTYPLLLALALDQQKRRPAARELLRQNNLTSYVSVLHGYSQNKPTG